MTTVFKAADCNSSPAIAVRDAPEGLTNVGGRQARHFHKPEQT
jgi:hypothetical protein